MIYERKTPLFTKRYEVEQRESQFYAKLQCPWCETKVDVPVELPKFEAWIRKELMIQEAMPELSADLREMFLSGNCATCWRAMFNEGPK